MDVVVYTGQEILPLSLANTLTSLKNILLPHYTIRPISQLTLATQPWKASCALLVIPQLQNPKHGFISLSSKLIQEFVEAGGRCLIFGARAYVKSRFSGLEAGMRGLTFGLETEPQALPLKFFDKANNCYVSLDMDEDDTNEDFRPHIATLATDGTDLSGIYNVGTTKLVGFEEITGVSVLARYKSTDGGKPGMPACLSMKTNKGNLALSSAGIEHPMTEQPVSSFLTSFSSNDLQSSETARRKFLRNVLQQLGLNLPDNDSSSSVVSSQPLPQFLTSTPRRPGIVATIVDAISRSQSPSWKGDELKVVKEANDEFHFHSFDEGKQLIGTLNHQPKHIIVCRDGLLPGRKLTPHFDLETYYQALDGARESEGGIDSEDKSIWGVGQAVLYGEVVTSTQTMLNKNPKFLSNLPTPFLSLASHQLEGRGRGTNSWLSPLGCLQFSLVLRLSLSSTPTTPAFPAEMLVFVQYLLALAVVEACRDQNLLGPDVGSRVKIKWPNDLYADVGADGKEDLKKIGGILVNTNFQGAKVDIVIGCGLNVLTKPPIASLTLLQAAHSTDQLGNLTLERTAAVILAKFEPMWDVFIRERSFQPFMHLYLRRWLHSDQLVTLTTTDPHIRVRIVGITSEHGLLRTVPERRSAVESRAVRNKGEAEFIDLQPDGNSFDLMTGLIKTKT